MGQLKEMIMSTQCAVLFGTMGSGTGGSDLQELVNIQTFLVSADQFLADLELSTQNFQLI